MPVLSTSVFLPKTFYSSVFSVDMFVQYQEHWAGCLFNHQFHQFKMHSAVNCLVCGERIFQEDGDVLLD